MKKFFLAMMAVAAIAFTSCESSVQSQAIVDWGFESSETPGKIDGNPFASITLNHTQEAIVKEIEDNANWETTDYLVSGGRIVRLSATTEENTKKELTALFEAAIKKAEDTMKEKGYEAQPMKENILAIYKFIRSESEETTLTFPVTIYYRPEK